MRPVVVVQSDLLNETDHPSMWVLPCTRSERNQVGCFLLTQA
ncbi:MAG: hypothetical protein ACLQU2_36200 [Candidatus Binataceae bacterium]